MCLEIQRSLSLSTGLLNIGQSFLFSFGCSFIHHNLFQSVKCADVIKHLLCSCALCKCCIHQVNQCNRFSFFHVYLFVNVVVCHDFIYSIAMHKMSGLRKK